MCGRFTLSTSPEELARCFQVVELPGLSPRYNIAPTQQVATVRAVVQEQGGARELRLLRWGLVPSWAEDLRVGNRMINARSETAAKKPAFRSAFRKRRCLVLADGFFEWRRRGKSREPHFIYMRDRRPFAIAGLWEQWADPEDGEVTESCTLLTTGPNELVEQIHDRMPVILEPGDYDLWLDPQVSDPEQLEPLLRPYPAAEMTSHAVSSRVNSPRNDDPSCLKRMEQTELF